ncbi:MAG TPA: YceI family protein [Flavobacteriaceae bacterium]|nr:YceI family protein [Flavobacteriaceae bacterium]
MNTTTKWELDPTHSELTFKVKHLMISNVKGEFRNFDATVESSGNDFSNAKIDATIDAASLDTNNVDRDKHLKSADFFDAENNSKITFHSTDLNKLDEDNFQLKGILAMKGKEKEITLDVDFGGFMKDPYGNEKAGFSMSGKINRKDWGLNWNAALETGGVMVSDEVRINAEVQLVKKAGE